MDITAKVLRYHGDGVYTIEQYNSQTPGIYYPSGQLYSIHYTQELTIGGFYDIRMSNSPQPVDHTVYGVVQRNL